MRIILSPAKKMNDDQDSLPVEALPLFLPQTQELLTALRSMSHQALQKLWRCNDAIAQLNLERLASMDLRKNLTPAILSYEGIQYQYMAPSVMNTGQLSYLQEHMRILSGFYGLLRPFDGVTPYRLEMQAKLPVGGAKDLYAFWGGRLAEQLKKEAGWVLNLASKEYSRAVTPYLPKDMVVTCVFGQWLNGKAVEKGTLCKMARGQMVRWLAENRIGERAEIRAFADLDYRFDPDLSTENQFVFLKGGR